MNSTMRAAELPAGAESFLDALKNRRSIYALNKDVQLSDDALLRVIKAAVKIAPSADDHSTTRAVILLGKHHEALWDRTKDAVRAAASSAERAAAGVARIEGCFQAGYGTVLFFEDERALQAMKETSPTAGKQPLHNEEFYKNLSQQNNAAAQLAVWIALSQSGLGASLQHYQRLVEDGVHRNFRIPPWWRLEAMMPFGGIAQPAAAKEFAEVESRLMVMDGDGLSSYGNSSSNNNSSEPSQESKNSCRKLEEEL